MKNKTLIVAICSFTAGVMFSTSIYFFIHSGITSFQAWVFLVAMIVEIMTAFNMTRLKGQ